MGIQSLERRRLLAGASLVELPIRDAEAVAQLDQFSLVTTYSVEEGAQLWRTNGTVKGTRRLARFPASDPIAHLTVYKGNAYFVADDGVHGEELWRSDGSAFGTGLVKDVNRGAGDAEIDQIAIFKGVMYFGADDGKAGRELWRSGGSGFSTRLLSDVQRGAGSSSPGDFAVINDRLYFSAARSGAFEPWAFDGGRMRRLADLSAAGSDAQRFSFTPAGEKVVFVAANRLWATRGTRASTRSLVDLREDGFEQALLLPEGAAEVDGRVLLRVESHSGVPESGPSELHIWSTDGSRGGTSRLDGFPAAFEGHFVAQRGLVWFIDDDGEAFWKSDGTEAGTRRVTVLPGEAEAQPQTLAFYNGSFYAIARNPNELWRLSTDEGVRELAGFSASADGARLHVAGDVLYLSEGESAGMGGRLFRVRLQTPGIAVAGGIRGDRNLVITGSDGSDSIDLSISGDVLVINANGNTQSRRLADIRAITIDTGNGDDTIELDDDVPATVVHGGNGDDVIVGSFSDDTLAGDGGRDGIRGRHGDDLLLGGAGDDTVHAGQGADTMSGDEGDDLLFSFDRTRDTVSGGGGKDLADADGRLGFWRNDLLDSLEDLLSIKQLRNLARNGGL